MQRCLSECSKPTSNSTTVSFRRNEMNFFFFFQMFHNATEEFGKRGMHPHKERRFSSNGQNKEETKCQAWKSADSAGAKEKTKHWRVHSAKRKRKRNSFFPLHRFEKNWNVSPVWFTWMTPSSFSKFRCESLRKICAFNERAKMKCNSSDH